MTRHYDGYTWMSLMGQDAGEPEEFHVCSGCGHAVDEHEDEGSAPCLVDECACKEYHDDVQCWECGEPCSDHMPYCSMIKPAEEQ